MRDWRQDNTDDNVIVINEFDQGKKCSLLLFKFRAI